MTSREELEAQLDATRLQLDEPTAAVSQYVVLSQAWLGKFAASDYQPICPNAGDARSIARIPLSHRGKLLGSVNICSNDALARAGRDRIRVEAA
jgi:hypothetical protein